MRHRGMLAPINSIKHYVQSDNSQTATATRRKIIIVDAVAQNVVSAVQDVVEGSLVKAVFLEYWVKSTASAGTDTKFQLSLEKTSSGAASIAFAAMNTLMGYENKKNILFFSQGVLGDLTTGSIPVVRGWFKIPKGKQRMGLGDTITVSISATGADIDTCGFATYKEYK